MSDFHASSDVSLFALLRWVMVYALRRWLALATVGISLLLKVALDVLKPWPMLFLVDYVLQNRTRPNWARALVEALPGPHTPSALIAWSVGATIVLFLIGWSVGLAQTCAGINLGQRMVYDLAADVFAQLQQLSLHFHARRTVGDSIRRVTADCACIATILRDALLPAASACVSLVVMFFILWKLSPSLTLLALTVVPFMVLIFNRYAQPMLDGSYQQQEVEGRTYEVVEQTFSSMPVVQAFCREKLNEERFARATSDALALTLSLTRLQLRFKILMGLSTALGTAAILWFGTRLALEGQFSVGAILLFLSYLGSLYAPLEAVMYSTSTIQGAAGSARRVREVLDAKCEVMDKPGAAALPKAHGRVTLEKVTFGYEPERAVLRDVSLEAHPGETIALVGATGAGKSTLVSLIPRFFDPWNGRVLIDGCDVREVKLKSLRSQIGIVLQEAFLFPLTVAENIAYGRPKATPVEIEAAARTANAHEFIVKLPEGYQTVIGERGATLSVGQRQRLSIARALLKNAPILILDEPTSALDAETEQRLLDALQHLVRDRTTFIIAHRLSTVRRAHRVVVLHEGCIIESGTHDQLMAAGGAFARFHSLQFGQPYGPRAPA
jgi:ATP-binding cassette subfamily B protein/subfamily B ATP-binding cassette protein MsbA